MDLDPRINQFWGGKVPDGFQREFEAKTKFMNSMNIKGSLQYLALLELLWAWRDFFPGKVVEEEPLEDYQPPPETAEEPQEEPEPPPETWDTVQPGRRVATFWGGKLVQGTFVGHAGEDRAKISLTGDDKKYRIIDRVEIDLNG